MQAVILIAGKSTRTYPLTLTRPKALLPIANKPLIHHILESLKGRVDEAILVVGYMKEAIKDSIGNEFKGMKITYVDQKEQLGTANAVLSAKGIVKGRFIVMVGDDVFHGDNIDDVLKQKHSVLTTKVDDPSRFGVWILEGGKVRGFAEKPKEFVSDMTNCSLYVLDEGIFPEIEKLEKSERGEYELNEAVNSFAKKEDVFGVDAQGKWFPVGYPWDLLDINERVLKELRGSKIDGKVEPNATIKGNVVIGKGTIVRNGSYIQGPVSIGEDCVIGPNCFIRSHTSIGNNCNIGNAVEVKNSIIMGNTNVGHLSYIGDSVIGYDVNVGAGTISANLKHNNENVSTCLKDKVMDTGRRKFGTVIGDGAHTGINTSIYPGRKIWPGKCTLPGEIVEKDIV